MNPRPIEAKDLNEWQERTGSPAIPHTFTGPGEVEMGIEPCEAVVTHSEGQVIVRVPWKLDEIEVAHLAKGGTLWLSTWGGLPIHALEVGEP